MAEGQTTAAGLPEGAAGALEALLGARVSFAAPVRAAHGRDESFHAPAPPQAVAFPRSTAEVSALVRLCAGFRLPLIPFGTGTSLEGGVAATRGGVSVDLSGMNRILGVNEGDFDCAVEAGVTRKQLNAHLRDTGLFFPVDPGADASLGGMCATRASGTNAVRYGTMRENVLALTVVLASGEVVRTAQRARKSAAGYDLTRLFVGSEGTLGIITEATLRLHGQPEAVAAAVCPFAGLEGAVATVTETLQAGIPVARIELLDALQVKASNAYSGLGLAETPTLFLEFHGTEAGIAEQVARFEEIARGHGAQGFDWADKTEDRNRLWTARHNAYNAARAMAPGKEGFVTDVCVPISQLADCIAETQADLAQSFLLAPLVGHVGDGNFHLQIMVDPSSAQDLAEAQRINERLVARAIAMEGTCTGEHGIGYGKKAFLAEEFGAGVSVMQSVKKALDPENLMNPGKVVDI